MGNTPGSEVKQGYQIDPIFDPHEGFKGKRKAKKMMLTEEQMDAANMSLNSRDYCAHLYFDFLKCRNKNYPLVYLCKVERNAHHHCQSNENLMRMKEMERERRLMSRKNKAAAAFPA